jgi:excisionase family DNA binding protein
MTSVAAIRTVVLVDDDIVGPDWLGTTDAARYLELAPLALYRLIDDGELPAYRFGRIVRLRKSDLDAYLVTCRADPDPLGGGDGKG